MCRQDPEGQMHNINLLIDEQMLIIKEVDPLHYLQYIIIRMIQLFHSCLQ